MACFRPVHGWMARRVNPSGKRSVVFRMSEGFVDRPVTVPCGRCIGCRLEKSRQWAMRGAHEASLHPVNSFVTLTYAPEHLPPGGSLVLRDLQLFMKRLRKSVPHKIRFLACGEYGENLSRPHYHVILFNHSFLDAKYWKSGPNNTRYYRSNTLESLWPYGYSSIGEANFESIAYVARYVTKKITGDIAEGYYQGRKPEFIVMSRRPGIGTEWFERFAGDVYPADRVVVRGRGVFRPPKFYDKLLDKERPGLLAGLKRLRVLKAAENPQEQTGTRLMAKEEVKEATSRKALTRSFEVGTS